MNILDGLNQEQTEAVIHTNGPLLIIAGAGTGKTTVITRRIAYLIEQGLAKPEEILALTFTEKAAGEMEERVEALLPIGYVDLWISTFHAFGERMLKEHAIDVGLPNDFKLLSDTEQWLLLREHIDEFELDYYRPKGNPTKFVQALISHFSRLKDEDITPQEYLAYAESVQLDLDSVQGEKSGKAVSKEEAAKRDEAQRVMEVAKSYKRYQDLLRANNALDFGDLIIETIHLLRERPAILQKYQEQFKFILVDEFQDTNYAQYDLIKLLTQPRNNLTVVADDDQAIYSFRGASMSNILIFKNDFPDAKEISLIQNYRSSQGILDLAYEFIQHNNPHRLEQTLNINKRLLTNKEATAHIEHLHAQTLDGEAKLVVDKIIALKENAEIESWSDAAILVRANDQAQAFIPYLERAHVPYQFLASQGLFVKPVVMDVIAFLKVIDHYYDSRSLYRVLTYTIWNIPHDDLVRILHYGNKNTKTLFETCKQIRAVTDVSPQTYDRIDSVMQLIDRLSYMARTKTVGEITLYFLEESGYLKWITSLPEQQQTENILYINQFYKYIQTFERAQNEKSVRRFVEELTMMIEAGEQGRLQPDFEEGPDAVKIMTVHSSKGLEFEYVFVVNLVDKRFPSIGRKETIPIPDAIVKDVVPDGDWHLAEERRLFYVALTRAKKGLCLTSALDYGGARKKKPSRFLIECGFVDTAPAPTGEVLFQKTNVAAPDAGDSVTKHLPKAFSFSQLQAYETCGWQYRFAFLLKIPIPGKPSFSFGKSMHATLYEFFRRMQEAETLKQGGLFDQHIPTTELGAASAAQSQSLEELLQIYEEQWIKEWYQSTKQHDEYYKKGREALKQFYEIHHTQWPRVLMLEKGFNMKLGSTVLKGAIDRVDTLAQPSDESTAKDVEVIDYKTGDFPKTGKKDMEQLYMYALALREVMQLQPKKLTYYFLESNKTISEDVDEAALEKVSEWVLSLTAKILEGNFVPNPGFHCQFCDFKDICEFRSK